MQSEEKGSVLLINVKNSIQIFNMSKRSGVNPTIQRNYTTNAKIHAEGARILPVKQWVITAIKDVVYIAFQYNENTAGKLVKYENIYKSFQDWHEMSER